MSIFLAAILVLIGFVLLIWSADVLVDNASELASELGVSTFLIGVVIVGFGTSAPELFVSAMAAIENKGNLALGNALGSNITNIGLVLGVAALVKVMPVERSVATRDQPDNSSVDLEPADQSQTDRQSLGKSFAWTIASIIVLMLASRILVLGAVTIAEFFEVSELIIGLTIVAIGTSLPELAAAISAARKNEHEMIIGNIIGSNAFNTLGVLGLTGALRATELDTGVLTRDFPIMFLFTVSMLLMALIKKRFGRIEGGILVAGYFSYLGFLLVSAS